MRLGWIVAIGLWVWAVPGAMEAQEAETGAESEASPEPVSEPGPEAEPAQEPAPAEKPTAIPEAASESTRILVQGGEAVDAGETEMAQAGGEEPDLRPQVVQLKEPPRDRLSQSADAGALRGLRVLGVQDGVARVLFADGTERALRAGDVVSGDVVRSVSPHRMLLDRRAGEGQDGGSATVIVKLGAGGASQVYVLWTRNPRPSLAPQVKR